MDNEKLQELAEKNQKELEELKIAISRLQIKASVPQSVLKINEPDDFRELKLLLNSNQWPEAIDPSFIDGKEDYKEDRAEGIVELIIDMPLEGLSILDFGCGEGYVVNRIKKYNPKLVVGYDPITYDKWTLWEKSDNTRFTTDWSSIQHKFDVVLCYDVLDHIEGNENNVISWLKKIKGILSPNGKVFVRCHPWSSRHATHLCNETNKAFVHLVFSEEELAKLGLKNPNIQKVIHPYKTYLAWFAAAGFQATVKNTISVPVEPFFQDTTIIANRIKKNWQASPYIKYKNGQIFPPQLAVQFIDYILT